LFAGPPHSGLWDGHIVNGICGLASIAQNSVCVLRALLPLTARHCGLATGGAAPALIWALVWALAWALAVAASPAAAQPDDDDWRSAAPGWEDRRGWSRAVDRLWWLRRSRDGFQDVMHKLARRSAGLPGPRTRPPAPPERDWPPMPPDGPEPEEASPRERPPERPPERLSERPPERPPEWPGERVPERTQERRRVAEPGPDRNHDRDGDHPGGPPVKEWHGPPSCRKAGVPVEGAGWYVVAPGDTLWRIAQAHYGDGGAWRRIRHANWETIADPDLVYACQRLFIPGSGRDRPPLPPCADPEPPRPPCHRPRCDEPRPWPPRGVCQRSPPPLPDRGPGGCSRCGAGAHVGAWGWR